MLDLERPSDHPASDVPAQGAGTAPTEALRSQLEPDLLASFVARQRWYADKDGGRPQAMLDRYAPWGPWLLSFPEIRHAGGKARYFLPLGLRDPGPPRPETVLGRVTLGGEAHTLTEASGSEAFCRDVLRALCRGDRLAAQPGSVSFLPGGRCTELVPADLEAIRVAGLSGLSSNTGITLVTPRQDRPVFLKLCRRLLPGTHPEVEVGRFLTEVARFGNSLPLIGSVEYAPGQGHAPSTLMIVQPYVAHQVDGWTWVLRGLERLRDADLALEGNGDGTLAGIPLLARRTAELHAALSLVTGDAAFDPEPWTPADLRAWKQSVMKEARESLAMLRLLDVRIDRKEVLARIDACAAPAGPALKTRHHGDYHLGQVLKTGDDFLIVDFEGEPGRSLKERRRKHTPMRDVAGMLRSFDYAQWTVRRRAHPGLGPALQRWETAARSAFLDSYARAMAGHGSNGDLQDLTGLLELAELEKVFYELRYEAGNRPEWIDVPLQGLRAILDRPRGAP